MGTRVRNAAGKPLPCCWNDCTADGFTEQRIELPHDAPRFPGEKLVYVFCSPMHRALWANGSQSYGNVAERRSPLGLIVP